MSKNHLSTLPYLHISSLNINDKFDPIMEAQLRNTLQREIIAKVVI